MSRDQWRDQDRGCPPCGDCGEALYEEFWGNGGWIKTSVATLKPHSERECIVRLTAKLAGATSTQADEAVLLLVHFRPLDEHHVELLGRLVDRAQNDPRRWKGGGSISEARLYKLRNLRNVARSYNDAIAAFERDDVKEPWQ